MVLHGFASRSPKNRFFQSKHVVFLIVDLYLKFFFLFLIFQKKNIFVGLLRANPCRTIMKLPQKMLDPKRAKLDQRSGFRRLVSVS